MQLLKILIFTCPSIAIVSLLFILFICLGSVPDLSLLEKEIKLMLQHTLILSAFDVYNICHVLNLLITQLKN